MSSFSRGKTMCDLALKACEASSKNLEGGKRNFKGSEKDKTEAYVQSLSNKKPIPSLEFSFDEIGIVSNQGIIEEIPGNTITTGNDAPVCLSGQFDRNTITVSNINSMNSLTSNSLITLLVEDLVKERSVQDECLMIQEVALEVDNNDYLNETHTDDHEMECVFEHEISEEVSNTNNLQQNEKHNNDQEILNIIEDESCENTLNETIIRENDHQEDPINDSDTEETESKARPRKGRKQKYPGQSRSMRKKRKNSNELYYSARGKEVQPREFKNYICLCKNRCHEKVSPEIRENEFKKYWELGSYDAQTAFIGAMVLEKPVKRHYTKDENHKKQFSRIYTINKVAVCREMFVYSFGLSPKRISTALTKIRSSSITDKRGVSGGHNKLSDVQLEEVVNHITKIPKYKSHYAREKTDREYLPTHMTLQVMYDLYKIDCTSEPVSISKYREIFYSHFNLRRKKYQKDTCNLCDSLQIKICNEKQGEAKRILEAQKEDHMTAQENARQALRDDKKLAKNNAQVETLTFDLEKTLSLPKIPTNIVYYKRQLSVYNLGIHAAKLNQSYCFVWVESEAGRGAQEIGSCLRKYFSRYIDPNVKHVNLWSDSCGGQNRNIKIVLILQHLLYSYPNLESISLKFLVSGHSYLPNDTDFAYIETALKQQMRLYTVVNFISVITTCKKKKPLIVVRMEKADFVSTKSLENCITNRKTDAEKNKINWLKWREITLHKSLPFILNYKTRQGHLTPYNQLSIKKRLQGRPLTEHQVFGKVLVQLWPVGKAISVPKLNDIKSMMHLIPSDAKGFYKQVFSSETIDDDIDGYNVEELDFEMETNENLPVDDL